ncbi:MAG TPA: hypothetical protein VFO67_02380, partial [Gemmatimonadales bacterium]|nr:hypothetical protein [Gemmatimonadales bacterium]
MTPDASWRKTLTDGIRQAVLRRQRLVDKTHLRNIFRKMNVSSRVALARAGRACLRGMSVPQPATAATQYWPQSLPILRADNTSHETGGPTLVVRL